MLKALKAALAEQPDNEALKEQIRALDLELRQEYIAPAGVCRRGAPCCCWAGSWCCWPRPRRPRPCGGSCPCRSRRAGPRPPGAVDAVGPLGGRRRGRGAGRAAGVLIARYGPLPGRPTSQAKGTVPSSGQARRDESSPQILGQSPYGRGNRRSLAAIPRARRGSGISAYANVPESWDGPSGKNILWKTPVPLPGNSSPVVWGSRVFLSGADANHREVYCFDAADGTLALARRSAATRREQQAAARSTTTPASPRPPWRPTAGWSLAVFANGDVAAFDFDGKLVWSRSLGVPDNPYGHAASLTIFHDLLLVPMDQGHAGSQRVEAPGVGPGHGQDRLAAAAQAPNSWSSPIVIHAAGRDQLITTGDPWVIAYDLPGGGELWRAKCLDGEIGPSPVFANGLVYAAGERTLAVSRHRARRPGRREQEQGALEVRRGPCPTLCSPLATERFLFLLTSYGPLDLLRRPQGKKLWEDDLDEIPGAQVSFGVAGHGRQPALPDQRGGQGPVVVAADATGCKRVGRGRSGRALRHQPRLPGRPDLSPRPEEPVLHRAEN